MQQGLSCICHPIKDLQNQRLWKVAPLRTVACNNPMEEENKENQIQNQTNFSSVFLRCSQNTAWVPSENTWKMMTESSSRFGFGSPHFPLPLVVWEVLGGRTDARTPCFVKNPPQEGDHFQTNIYLRVIQ